ncbi:unnamed protein product [Vitrella brassicaformis CCMP3155]|uniref:Uncharacterized protein n=1 Tax=Vitrella brassicaformis (strain CCMP3155) TaxID=1169540 RepID=A0A0G4FWK5_VITBC|nr:unnamed protein product [Vitrella brassicaformis CCMP3155]|mmetsp:Transcript_26151/g.75059  ORF Transcript_26151/g.75059 Transcript_26151/m.75059 type:complete len:284 (-) Transcript_26151:284-1135(-)|eukprot:CEM19236.1 unnamed protein product [Vitrella brassicaformis CCMP3155]
MRDSASSSSAAWLPSDDPRDESCLPPELAAVDQKRLVLESTLSKIDTAMAMPVEAGGCINEDHRLLCEQCAGDLRDLLQSITAVRARMMEGFALFGEAYRALRSSQPSLPREAAVHMVVHERHIPPLRPADVTEFQLLTEEIAKVERTAQRALAMRRRGGLSRHRAPDQEGGRISRRDVDLLHSLLSQSRQHEASSPPSTGGPLDGLDELSGRGGGGVHGRDNVAMGSPASSRSRMSTEVSGRRDTSDMDMEYDAMEQDEPEEGMREGGQPRNDGRGDVPPPG